MRRSARPKQESKEEGGRVGRRMTRSSTGRTPRSTRWSQWCCPLGPIPWKRRGPRTTGRPVAGGAAVGPGPAGAPCAGCCWSMPRAWPVAFCCRRRPVRDRPRPRTRSPPARLDRSRLPTRPGPLPTGRDRQPGAVRQVRPQRRKRRCHFSRKRSSRRGVKLGRRGLSRSVPGDRWCHAASRARACWHRLTVTD